jgi:hypothetical protein
MRRSHGHNDALMSQHQGMCGELYAPSGIRQRALFIKVGGIATEAMRPGERAGDAWSGTNDKIA